MFASLEVVTPFLLWASQLNWVYLSTPAKDKVAFSLQSKFRKKEKHLPKIFGQCAAMCSFTFDKIWMFFGVLHINLREKCHVTLKREARHVWVWLTSLLYLKDAHASASHRASAKVLQWKRLTMAFAVFWVLGLLLNNVSFVLCFPLPPCQKLGSEAGRCVLYFSLQNKTSPNQNSNYSLVRQKRKVGKRSQGPDLM